MNDYARAPNQPLLTTSSPTFAGLTVTGAATFASTVTATGQFLAGDGTDGAPSYAFASAPTYGMRFNPLTGTVFIHGGGESWGTKTGQLALPSSSSIVWTNGALSAAGDLYLARLAAASIRVGAAPSATPIAQSLTIGEASRPGTDTDVGGASGTIASGLGTGAGAASSLIFQTPTVGSTGSTVQSLATRLTVATAGITATVPVLVTTVSGGTIASITLAVKDSGGTNRAYAGADANGARWTFLNSVGGPVVRIETGGLTLGSDRNVSWTSSDANASADLLLTRHSAANLRQGAAAANDADGVAQTLRSPGGGTVSSGTTGRNGGAYTITAGNGSDAKSGSNANGGNGGILTLTGGAKGLKDGGGSDGLDGGVQVSRSGGLLGFYGVSPIARAVLATGTGATVDNVITALQNLGLVSQS